MPQPLVGLRPPEQLRHVDGDPSRPVRDKCGEGTPKVEINRTLTNMVHAFTRKVGPHITYQRGIRTMAKNQELNEEMHELIEESTSTSLLKELGTLNRDRVNATPNIEAAVPSDVNTLLSG
jgi:hypothetical protein